MAFVFLYSGCATGPTYEYSKQQDSASVEGAIAPFQGSTNGSCHIQIARIDGLIANFDASRPGANWSITVPKEPLYLSPGKHTLTLELSEIEGVYGDTGHGRTGEVGAFTAGSTPTITAEFMANHIYRFAADIYGKMIDLALWDETTGSADRTRVKTWTLDSNRNYSESVAPGGNHR